MDDSVRKKTSAAPVIPAIAHSADPLAAFRVSSDEPVYLPDPAEVVPLRSGRKGRPKGLFVRSPESASIDRHIGSQLKAIYDDVLNQPIPDRFLDLLGRLDVEAPADPVSGDEGNSS